MKSVCVIGPSLTSRIRQIDPTFELCSPASRSINRGGLKRVPLQRCKPILSISSPISYLILPFLKQSNRSLPKNIPSNFSYRKKKGKEREERKGNIFNEFQTNGSILFQHFVKKKKRTFLEKLLRLLLLRESHFSH